MSIEGFTCLLVFKNVFSFGLTFKGFDWLVESGDTKHMFVALGSVQVAICALTIPMCTYPCRLACFPVDLATVLTLDRYIRQEKQEFLPQTQRLLQGHGLDCELHDWAVCEGEPGFGMRDTFGISSALVIGWSVGDNVIRLLSRRAELSFHLVTTLRAYRAVPIQQTCARST